MKSEERINETSQLEGKDSSFPHFFRPFLPLLPAATAKETRKSRAVVSICAL